MNTVTCVLLSALSLCVSAGAAETDPLDSWTWQRPLPQGNSLLGVVWTGDAFIAAGMGGTVMSSTDGFNWKHLPALLREIEAPSNWRENIHHMKWTGSEIIALGRRGAILRTSDGVSWEDESLPWAWFINAVAIAPDRMVAVSTGAFFVRDDGGDWEVGRALSMDWRIEDVVWTGTFFAAVGIGHVAVSTTGAWWNVYSTPSYRAFRTVVWTGDRLLAAGDHCMVFSSTNGEDWKFEEQFRELGSIRRLVPVGDRWGAVGSSALGIITEIDGEFKFEGEEIEGESFSSMDRSKTGDRVVGDSLQMIGLT